MIFAPKTRFFRSQNFQNSYFPNSKKYFQIDLSRSVGGRCGPDSGFEHPVTLLWSAASHIPIPTGPCRPHGPRPTPHHLFPNFSWPFGFHCVAAQFSKSSPILWVTPSPFTHAPDCYSLVTKIRCLYIKKVILCDDTHLYDHLYNEIHTECGKYVRTFTKTANIC